MVAVAGAAVAAELCGAWTSSEAGGVKHGIYGAIAALNRAFGKEQGMLGQCCDDKAVVASSWSFNMFLFLWNPVHVEGHRSKVTQATADDVKFERHDKAQAEAARVVVRDEQLGRVVRCRRAGRRPSTSRSPSLIAEWQRG
ncbi:uncharacterized protein CCOS01_02144 [Colletotrichum costaricense]|uniref:Uncharacterized protein n=1 Tax=Colletotrichum costaricense TaxID=1209916 RepID=A0AAI9Z7F6_9PEZI|nr:uncharacterized protein CCOS01_02144 [Colletotrichum costaricense]KAK1536824.1 hypothetical protein CCOS01_02144 [Colletotrichum costaricense]